jgi:DNA-binding transcriptional LysR family regulator
MNWDDLRVFLAVARGGLVSRAAAELGLDPTTVSRRIQRLESSVGQTLLVRQRSGPRLTEAGRRLLADAESVERTAASLAMPAEAPCAILRVSVTEGFGTWFIAHHLGAFARDTPHVQVDLVATSGFLSPSKRETDVAILLARPRRGPLVTRKLSDYALGLYASAAYLEGAKIGCAGDLRGHPLVGYIPGSLYAPELDYLGEVAPGLEPTLRSSSINAQYRMIASGAGVGVLPRFIGDADAALAPVLPEVEIRRSFWLSTHRDTRRLDHVDRFVTWLVALTGRRQRQLLG